ncbi:MAG: tetratricopeptide repeat protein [Magnetococcus sp. WYHC-3]
MQKRFAAHIKPVAIACVLAVASVVSGKEGDPLETVALPAPAGTNRCCPTNQYQLAVQARAFANTNQTSEWKTRFCTEAINLFSHLATNHPDSPDAPKALFSQGSIYDRLDRLDEAFEVYDRFMARYPEHPLAPEALARIGQCFLRKGKEIEQQSRQETNSIRQAQFQQEATNYYRTAAQKFGLVSERYFTHPLAGKTKLLSAQCYQRSQDYDRAITVFQELMTERKSEREVMAEALYWLGYCYQRGKNEIQAYRVFKRLIWDYPESNWAKGCHRLNPPDGYKDEGESLKPDAAILLSASVRTQTVATTVAPDSRVGVSPTPTTKTATPLQQARELRDVTVWAQRLHCKPLPLPDAVAAYRNVITRAANSAEARTAAWEIAERHETLANKARELLLPATGDSLPDTPEGYRAQAIKLYQELADTFPDTPEGDQAYAKIVEDYMIRNDSTNALKKIETFVANSKHTGGDQMLFKGCLVAYKMADYAKAKAMAEQLIVEHPDSASAEKARQVLPKILDKLGVSSDVAFPNHTGSADVVAKLLAKAAEAAPSAPMPVIGPTEAQELLAAAKADLRNKKKAWAALRLEQILNGRVNESTPEARYWMGEIYRESQDLPTASYHYQELIWDYPESRWAKYARWQLTNEAFRASDMAK